MKSVKSTQIKCRVTPEFKKELNIFAEKQNTSPSAIIYSAVSAYKSACESGKDPLTDNYIQSVKEHLLLNKIYNLIRLDSSSTIEEKNKIMEVLQNVR